MHGQLLLDLCVEKVHWFDRRVRLGGWLGCIKEAERWVLRNYADYLLDLRVVLDVEPNHGKLFLD
jgi:hypothetical protein